VLLLLCLLEGTGEELTERRLVGRCLKADATIQNGGGRGGWTIVIEHLAQCRLFLLHCHLPVMA